MKLEPMGKRILAKQSKQEKEGLIYVPDSVQKQSLLATVIAVGMDVIFVEKGDQILFGRYAKFDVPLKGEEWRDYFIMNEEDILTKVHE